MYVYNVSVIFRRHVSDRNTVSQQAQHSKFFLAALEEIAASSVEHHDEADLRFEAM
jgi:hypothetical protein